MQELFFSGRSGKADTLPSTMPWAQKDSAAWEKGELNLNKLREARAGTGACFGADATASVALGVQLGSKPQR